MEVIIKGDATTRHQMNKQLGKPGALAQMKGLYEKELDKSNNPWWRGRIDVSAARKNADQYKKNLEKILPEKLRPEVKDQMWVKAKRLKDEFIVGMLSREELHPVKGFMENDKVKWVVDEQKVIAFNSVARNTAWYKKNDAKLREYKNIMRHLCPEDPNAGDVEKFRPKMRGVR